MFQQAQRIPEQRRGEFQMAYHAQRKDRSTALILSLFLGHFGIDRFYLGQTALGVFKLLTFGGFFFWTMIDWFLIMGAADSHNATVVTKLAMMYPAALPAGPQSQPTAWQSPA
jgi:TM2 domain-containing membrane protein YozV